MIRRTDRLLRAVLRGAGVALLSGTAACHAPRPMAAPQNRPVALGGSTQTYTDTVAGISFHYPAGWTSGHGKTAIFEADSPDHRSKLSLDVPSLPFHLPGMITASAVANGYINDLKKRFAGATVQQNDPVTIPDAAARRVKIVGQETGAQTTDSAVLIVHADRVYILSSDGSGGGVAAAATALDVAAGSLRWMK